MLTTREFKIEGMTCHNCTKHVAEVFLSLDGVASTDVDLTTGSSVVRFDPEVTDLSHISETLTNMGYTLVT